MNCSHVPGGDRSECGNNSQRAYADYVGKIVHHEGTNACCKAAREILQSPAASNSDKVEALKHIGQDRHV